MYYTKSPLCIDCIWHDQCQCEESCEYYDRGGVQDGLLSDEEVETMIENGRQEFREEFEEYVRDYD